MPGYIYKFTPEMEKYLKRLWGQPVDSIELQKRCKKKFGDLCPGRDRLYKRCKDMFGPRPESVLAEIHKQSALKCIQRRGEDFAQKQRIRALTNPKWFGGNHWHGGNGFSREKRAELAKKWLHAPGIRERAHEARRETVRKERQRISWGLEQKTKIKIGHQFSYEIRHCRFNMKHDNNYEIFPGDPNVYYDSLTRRSQAQEARAIAAGMKVLPLDE